MKEGIIGYVICVVLTMGCAAVCIWIGWLFGMVSGYKRACREGDEAVRQAMKDLDNHVEKMRKKKEDECANTQSE